jgi:hypothetical protein
LPCWWHITPGVTLWQDVQEKFSAHDKLTNTWETSWGTGHRVMIVGRRDPVPFDYVVEHRFYETDGRVDLIGVYGHVPSWPAEGSPSSTHFATDWHRYRLDQVLARLGRPSKVLLHYWSEAVAPYSVALLYEDQGVLIEYMGLTEPEPADDDVYGLNPIVICLSHERVTDINLWLASPDFLITTTLAEVFQEVGGGYLMLLPYGNTPTLESAAGMDLDAFYYEYIDAESDRCLSVDPELGDWYP